MRLINKFKHTSSLFAGLLILGGLGLIANGGYMIAKAQLAQVLLSKSWSSSLADGGARRPWAWADTHVAARIQFLSLDEERYVMRDVSGESLAFGPGIVEHANSGAPSQENTHSGIAIAGHRDSHFGVLQHLQTDDLIQVETIKQMPVRFKVVSSTVVDTRHQSLAPPAQNELVLITCFPFESIVPGGPLRYVVFAVRADDSANDATVVDKVEVGLEQHGANI